MTAGLLAMLMIFPAGTQAQPSPYAGHLWHGEYTNTLLGFSMRLPGKWELRELPGGDTVSSGGAQGNALTEQKPSQVCLELESEKVGVMFVCGFRRDSRVDLREQVDAAFALSRKRLVVQGPDPIVTKTWKDRQLVIQDHAGIQGETETLLGFESAGYAVVITTVAYKGQGKRLEGARRTLTFSSESPDFPSGLLLRSRHSEMSAFSFGATDKEITLFQEGTLNYECRYTPMFEGSKRDCGRASLKLSEAELAGVKEMLASKPIASLEDEYPNDSIGLDYSATMTILIPRQHGGQWVLLRNLGFSGEKNNKLYPPAVRSLVCKIFGLRQRAGVPYSRATTLGARPEDKPHDDTWCDESSLRLETERRTGVR